MLPPSTFISDILEHNIFLPWIGFNLKCRPIFFNLLRTFFFTLSRASLKMEGNKVKLYYLIHILETTFFQPFHALTCSKYLCLQLNLKYLAERFRSKGLHLEVEARRYLSWVNFIQLCWAAVVTCGCLYCYLILKLQVLPIGNYLPNCPFLQQQLKISILTEKLCTNLPKSRHVRILAGLAFLKVEDKIGRWVSVKELILIKSVLSKLVWSNLVDQNSLI